MLLSTTRPDGSVEKRTYDAAGRLTSLDDTAKDGRPISAYTYEYDAAGNIIRESSGTRLFITVEGIDTEMTYGTDNRLETYNGENILYDADNNMTFAPLGTGMTQFTYDSRNRLTDAVYAAYTYDANNIRVAITENGTTRRFVVNPNALLSQLLMETDEQGNPEAYYVYGLGLISRETPAGDYSIYHYDLRGSTVALTSLSGTITDEYIYGPYGELYSFVGETENRFLYNGRDGVVSDDNGLYYMRARYYNPEIKRFMNQDILLGTITNGQSLNRYAYVHGNPISFADPDGEAPWWVAGAVVGGIYGAVSQGISDLISGEISDWQTYVGATSGGAAGGLVLTSTGSLYTAAATYAGTKGAVTQGLYYITQPEKVNITGAALEAVVDFGGTVISGQIAGKLIGTPNLLHNHKWATKVITNYSTALFGKTAVRELWTKGIVAAIISGTSSGVIREKDIFNLLEKQWGELHSLK